MTDLSQQKEHITLSNPVSDHFAAFIFGNSLFCDRVVECDSAKGQTLVLCGAGPSLKETIGDHQGDQLWGCNSALVWLHDHGYKPTHGFCVDQTGDMVNEWESAPDVEYLLASTVHPHLTEFLLKKERKVRWFNNYVGITARPVQYDGRVMNYEDWLYAALYPGTVIAGSGLNAATRAIDVANYMGFEKITLLGADCAVRVSKPKPRGKPFDSPEYLEWAREHTVMHADGGNVLASNATAVLMDGEVCPHEECKDATCEHCNGTCSCPEKRRWYTKPDMMISAVFLVKMARLMPTLEFVGDGLPTALKDKCDAYLLKLPTLVDSKGAPILYVDGDGEGMESHVTEKLPDVRRFDAARIVAAQLKRQRKANSTRAVDSAA